MPTPDKPVAVEHIACEVCHKEVPLSEAIIPEAADYVAHFCGLDCYDQWKNSGSKPKEPVRPPGG